MLKTVIHFLSVIFFELGTSPDIMALFVTVATYDPKKVLFRAFRPCIMKSCITSNSKDARARVILFAFLFFKPLFKLCLSRFKGLCIPNELFVCLKS